MHCYHESIGSIWRKPVIAVCTGGFREFDELIQAHSTFNGRLPSHTRPPKNCQRVTAFVVSS